MKWLFAGLLVMFSVGLSVNAQTPADVLIYRWDTAIYAQPLDGSSARIIGTAYPGMDAALQPALTVTRWQESPQQSPPFPGYGFHQGVWSPDRQQFVYMLIEQGWGTFVLYHNDGRDLLMRGLLNMQGYLIPVAWLDAEHVVLIESHFLHHLDTVRVWLLNVPNQQLIPYFNNGTLGRLHGRPMLLPDGQSLFLGFNLTAQKGYVLDIANRQITEFSAEVPVTLPPDSVFELYPIQVLGAVPAAEVEALANRLNTATPQATLYPLPFLYYPLPDEERWITCYPDSEWTRALHPATCPHHSMTDYPGHQGTDIGGSPDGLPLGTDIFAALPGVVSAVFTDCGAANPSCNDAYGNTVLLEHVLVVDGNIQTWHTGYAHLQSVYVARNSVIRDLKQPIAASGATGTGGAHLHFEVRYPHTFGGTRWIDPYDQARFGTGFSLWMGGSELPLAAALTEFSP